MTGRLAYSRGLSLLEVLIAMLILAFGILGLAPLLVLSVDANSNSRDLSIATQLAKEELEHYESVATISGVPFTETEDNLEGKFSRTTYVSDHATDSLIPENRYKIVVVVSWVDDAAHSRSTQMSTLLKKD